MSLFPDCRVDDFYNEDFLNEKDKEFINGMDYITEEIQNLFLSNLAVYMEDLNYKQDLYKILEENKELLANIVNDWVEKERDVVITSMIDNMDESEYKVLRKKALEDNRTKEKPKEYYDSRKYACTGKKVFTSE